MRRRMARKLGAFPVIYARTAAARSTWRRPTGPTTLRGEAAEIFTRWDAAWTASSHRGRRRGATLHPPGRSVRRVGIFRGCSGGATRCHLPIAPARDRRSSLGTDTAFDCSRSPFRRRRFLHGAAFPPVRRRSRRYPCDRHHRSPVKEMTPTCHGSFDGKRGRPFPDHGDGPEARGVRRSRRGTIRRRFDPGNWGQTRPGSPILKAAIFRADRGRLQLVPANSAMQLPQSQ